MTIPVAREKTSVAPTGAASNIGLCPHMKTPGYAGGYLFIVNSGKQARRPGINDSWFLVASFVNLMYLNFYGLLNAKM